MDWHSRRISAILENALLEDKATSDATSRACIDPQQRATATVLAKQDCILSGVGAVARILEIYEQLDPNAIGHAEVISHGEIFDGVRLRKGQVIAVVRHNARVFAVLRTRDPERIAAPQWHCHLHTKFVDAIHGTPSRILDTRKTAPGLRVLDKYAVRCGGGHNHRLDLSDGILIKNNHITLAGSAAAALQRAIRNRRGELPIVIEVRNLSELDEALSNGAERLLLDNMSVENVRAALVKIKEQPRTIPGGSFRRHSAR